MNPKRLVVEGRDDQYSVIGLMRAYIPWPQEPGDWPVLIEIGKSADEILQAGYISAKLKDREVEILGIMFDADTNASGRYEKVRNQCLPMFPGLPSNLPASGLLADNGEKRLGVWIMPDNASDGDIEVFLRYLVPNSRETIWEYAVEAVAIARSRGALYRDCHTPKANLYTWLAWQDPPGQSPGIALTKRILDPTSPTAEPFVKWFRELYRV